MATSRIEMHNKSGRILRLVAECIEMVRLEKVIVVKVNILHSLT